MLSAVDGEWARESRVWAGWLTVLRGVGEFVPDMAKARAGVLVDRCRRTAQHIAPA